MRFLKSLLAVAAISVLVHFAVSTETGNGSTVDSSTQVSASSSLPASNATTDLNYRRHFIRNLTRDAWQSYHLQPMDEIDSSAVRIIGAMSTLHVMGLQSEFDQGKQWIEKNYNQNNFAYIKDVYRSISDELGGLLSAYSLTSEEMFREKASIITNYLLPAFNSKTGLLNERVHPDGEVNLLRSIGYQQPEIIFMADLTSNVNLKGQLKKISQFMKSIEKPNGLYMNMMDVETGNWSNQVSVLNEETISFFYNMVHSYQQSSGRSTEQLEMYGQAIKAVVDNGMIQASKSGRVYTGEYELPHKHRNRMHYGACKLGAMLSLGATSMANASTEFLKKQSALHMQLARNLTETCHAATNLTTEKLLPYSIVFNEQDDMSLGIDVPIIGPELAESYFILWRLTHKQKYRDYAWELAMAIEKYCRLEDDDYLEFGFWDNFFDKTPSITKTCQVYETFQSGTLKYLYLTFSEDTVLPLDEWIFTDSGHPLPICGKHKVYPVSACST